MSITVKTTSYGLSEKGIHIYQDYATGWVYFCVGIIVWITVDLLLPIGIWVALFVAIPIAIVLGFVITRLGAVQSFFHKRRIVSWDAVVKAEMKKNKVSFALKEGTYRSGQAANDEITVTVKNGKEAETQQFLKTVLSKRFLIREST
jgi:hypothetical protein